MAPTRTRPDRDAPAGSTAPQPLPLPLPHERDETSGPGATADGPPSEVMEQARKDLEAGLVDTDMRNGAGLDAAERERLVPTSTRAPKP